MPLKLYKRGDVWHYRGTVAGGRLRGSTGAADKTTAAKIASKVEAREWKRSVDGPQAVLTFAQAAMLYRAAEKSDRFLDKIEDYWKDTLVKDITPGAIRQSAPILYPTAGPATRNRHVIVPTMAVINHAAESELCQKISVTRFEFTRKIKKPATWEWVQAFMANSSPHLGGLCCFMFLTGARISEALRVQWEDIDLQERTVLIRQTKVGKERIAHLPLPLVIAISNIPRVPGKSVFRFSSAAKTWSNAVKRAGIAPLSFHSCRHGFATALLRAGVDVVTIAKLGGWETPQHVFQTYGHASDDKTLTDRIIDTDLTQAETVKAKKKAKSS